MSPEIEREVDSWHRTGIPPYPELQQCPQSGWSHLSRADLRLIHHIIGLSIDLHRRGLSGCTVWAQRMPKYVLIKWCSKVSLANYTIASLPLLCPMTLS